MASYTSKTSVRFVLLRQADNSTLQRLDKMGPNFDYRYFLTRTWVLPITGIFLRFRLRSFGLFVCFGLFVL
jgi:hypothetical protein